MGRIVSLSVFVIALAVLVLGCRGQNKAADEGAAAAGTSGGGVTAAGGSAGNADAGLPVVPRDQIDGEVTGEITGLANGEPFTVYTMISDVGADEPLNSTSWSRTVSGMNVDLLGYREKQTDRRGLVALHLRFDGDDNFIEDESRFNYFESAARVYMVPAGSVQVTSFGWQDEETLRIEGTFSGTGERDFSDEVVEVTEGKFSVEMIPPSTF